MQKDKFESKYQTADEYEQDRNNTPLSNPDPITHPIELAYKSQSELKMAYLPFIKNGGLFIATIEEYMMGQTIWVKVDLPDNNDPLLVSGEVVWKMPQESLSGGPQGIGVNFLGSTGGSVI
ncbi:MAG: pilus assembly protein PilZ [Gammaproteobacteria bacterium]|nr:pilus assembly protein PilZ [Gammaproteobacteria bacterium]